MLARTGIRYLRQAYPNTLRSTLCSNGHSLFQSRSYCPNPPPVAATRIFSRRDASELLLKAKREKGLKYEDIAKKIGRDKVWVAASIHGQTTMSNDEATTLCRELGMEDNREVLKSLQQVPERGLDMKNNLPPTDPTMYRFFELVMVYGPTFKDLIHEEFGDGIMSAIDLKVDFKRQPDPKGDRVQITLSGKFLPYAKW